MRVVLFRLIVEFIVLCNNIDRFGSIKSRPKLKKVKYQGRDDVSFRSFLIFCYEHTVYWKEKFDEHQVDPYEDEIDKILSRLPVLTKQDVLRNKNKITPSRYRRMLLGARKSSTGGSSGMGLKFYTSREFRKCQWMVWFRNWELNEVPISKNKIWVGGKSIFPKWYKKNYVYSWFSNTLYLNIYKLNDDDNHLLDKLISKYNICWIHGYPSTVSDLVSRFSHVASRVSVVTVSSETLLESQKCLFTSKSINVINHYGMSEGVINLSHYQDLWVSDDDFAYITRFPNGIHPAIGTGYRNKAFPLINYLVGDQFEFENNEVKSIVGRLDDFILLPSGRKLFRLDHLFKGLEEVVRAQIIQTDSTSALCVLEVVKGASLGIIEKTIFNRFYKMTTEEFTLKISIEADFVVTSNGKIKMVVNNLS